MSRPTLTGPQVTRIRTAGLTDTWWERHLRIPSRTIRNARRGLTYRHIATPPDTAPREGNGRGQRPLAQRVRVRREYFRE